MTKQEISTKQAPAAIGPYSQAIRVGNLLYTSGQIPLVPGAKKIEAQDLREQSQQVFKNLKAVVEAGGASVASIVKMNVFVTDLSEFAVLNEEYEEFFKEFANGTAFPARSTVQVSALPMGVKVEIEAIAEIL